MLMTTLRIKICGITNESDARLAGELGADAVGLNFYPKSPRFVVEERVESLLAALGPTVEAVGLFVNEPLQKVAAYLGRWPRIRAIQWHGEKPQVSAPSGFAYWPAFAVRDADSLRTIENFMVSFKATEPETIVAGSAILIDAHDP